jgi:HPt (histidine-containing phosphotransfer) domain-containing protein
MKHNISVKRRIKKYIPQFMHNTQNDINQLKQAAIEKNIVEMERISHSIKGYGKPFGFTELGNLATKINTAIKASQFDEAWSLIQELEDYFSKIEIVYRDD